MGEIDRTSPIRRRRDHMAWMFLDSNKKAEVTRTINAKQLEEERRAHEREINNMWANYIRQMSEEQNASLKLIVDEIHAHENKSLRRYQRMNITNRNVKSKKVNLKARRAEEQQERTQTRFLLRTVAGSLRGGRNPHHPCGCPGSSCKNR